MNANNMARESIETNIISINQIIIVTSDLNFSVKFRNMSVNI